MNLTIRQLSYVIATARCANVSTAAAELHVSQPSISASIDQMEAALGQRIFVRRRGSGATLTPFGRSIIEQSRRVLEEVRRLEHLALAEGHAAGEIVLGCHEDIAPYCVSALMRRLEAKWPKLRLVVQDEGFEALRRRLADGTLDLAITYDLHLDSGMATTVLRELRPHVLLAAQHPLATAATVSMDDIAAYPLVLSEQVPSWQHILDLFRLRSLTPNVFARARTFELQRSYVANGFGVALVYAEPFGNHSHDGLPLCRRPISDELPPHRIVVARDIHRTATMADVAVIEVAKSWFAERISEASLPRNHSSAA